MPARCEAGDLMVARVEMKYFRGTFIDFLSVVFRAEVRREEHDSASFLSASFSVASAVASLRISWEGGFEGLWWERMAAMREWTAFMTLKLESLKFFVKFLANAT